MPSSQPIFGGQPPPQPPTPATVVDPDFDPATLGPPPGAEREGEGRAAARAAGFPESFSVIAEDGTPLVAWLDDGPRVPMAPPQDEAPGPVVSAQQSRAPRSDPTGKTTEGEGLSLDVGDVEVTKPPAEPLTNGAVLDQADDDDPDDDLPDDEPADA